MTEESDDEVDSDESYVPRKGELFSSDHDSGSELDPNEYFDEVVDENTSCTASTSQLTTIGLSSPATVLYQPTVCASIAPVDNEDESDNDLTENYTNTSLFGRRNCFEWKSKTFSCAHYRKTHIKNHYDRIKVFILIRALRFDDSTTRKVKEETDPAAAVSNICNMFVENCQKNYAMAAHGCIDETHVPFKGRFRFLVYMPKKPAKYGLKLLCLTDTQNTYFYNAYIYTGKGSDGATHTPAERKLKIPSQAVVHLTKCLYKTNQNIMSGNWFC
ncbi:hypothetical protein PR048_006101 [Dryococelus australis]|uniref:PiggyBac transposable element-derived protein domain-containing protein n=1 Tax=Dryococelus australis TaxID=614101 RepID=A0ABQ9IA15_9NEOP|nr:hypothetical protein PR048_006101 [Dryococelus australis]